MFIPSPAQKTTVAIDKPPASLYAQSMRKTVCILLAFSLLLGLCACGEPKEDTPRQAGGLHIVTTIFPLYDWVKHVVGEEDARITMLLDTGVDLHSFQPTARDILQITACDVFLYVGGESDSWVADALQEAQNENLLALNLLSELGDAAKAEELAEGMEGEPEEAALDEHIWLSLKNAACLVDRIAQALSELDPAGASQYAANAAAYVQKLNALDARYEQVVTQASVRTLLFGDRFPFRYLTDDYGLAYYAAFSGCSAETEASFETVAFLAGKADELRLPAVLMIEGGDGRIAQTIVNTTQTKDQTILTLNSLQSVTAKDVQNGADYLAIMEENLSVLQAALTGKG